MDEQGSPTTLSPNNPVLKDAIQKMVGDVTLIRGDIHNLNYDPTATERWLFSADGSYDLGAGTISGATVTNGTFTGGSFRLYNFSCDFSNTARATTSYGPTGSSTVNASGTIHTTGINATGFYQYLVGFGGGNTAFKCFGGNPTFSCCVAPTGLSSSGNAVTGYWGLGAVTVVGGSAGHTFTDNHVGFKILRVGGVNTLYATNANGTTETATAITTITTANVVECIAAITSGTSVAYLVRKDNVAQTLVTHTTNIPAASTAEQQFQISGSNGNDGFGDMTLVISGMNYHR